MSNELSAIQPETIPAAFALPPMSFGLMKAVEAITDPHPDLGSPSEFPWHVKAEALAMGENLRHMATPVPEERLRVWVMPVLMQAVVATGKARTDDELEIWLASLQLGCGHLEVGAFTLETQRDALASIKFFPFVANIYEIVAPPAVRIRERFAALKRIILTSTAKPPQITQAQGDVA